LAQQPDELREMAQRWRDFAAVGHDEDRDWRIGFAEYLERLAAELDLARSPACKREKTG
jgi:hypothetical protein